MQLTNLMALWLLGLIPILIIIHNLKPQSKQIEAANLFLWQQVLKERSKGVRLQRVLIRNLLLLLQILAVLLATTALSKPIRLFTPAGQGDLLLVLDAGAGMKTRTPAGTRFDQALSQARKLIDTLPRTGRMLIIRAGGEPELLLPFTSDPSAIRSVLDRVQPTDAPGRIEKALYLALSFYHPGLDDRLYLITDGAGLDFKALVAKFPKVQTILVSGGGKNAGITRFEFRRTFAADEHYEIMTEIKNFNPEPLPCPFQLFLDETLIYQETLNLGPGERRLLILPYEGLMSGRAMARLDLEDDLAVDNEAYAVLNASEKTWILLASSGNFFLEKLLEGYPDVRVNKIDRIDPAIWEEQVTRHDVVIIDHMPFPATAKGNLLLIDSFSPSLPIRPVGRVDHPAILDWDHRSPLLAHLRLDRLAIANASLVRAEPFLKPLLESPATGLIYAAKQEGLRWIFFGFDLKQSDLPLRVAFPVMFGNMLQWLNPQKLSSSSAQVKAGEAFPLYPKPSSTEILVLPPDQPWQKYPVSAGPFYYTETRKTGWYKVAEGEDRRYFAVNLTDEAESDIQTPAPIAASDPGTGSRTPSGGTPQERPLWIWFLAWLPLLVAAEWFFWLKEH